MAHPHPPLDCLLLSAGWPTPLTHISHPRRLLAASAATRALVPRSLSSVQFRIAALERERMQRRVSVSPARAQFRAAARRRPPLDPTAALQLEMASYRYGSETCGYFDTYRRFCPISFLRARYIISMYRHKTIDIPIYRYHIGKL